MKKNLFVVLLVVLTPLSSLAERNSSVSYRHSAIPTHSEALLGFLVQCQQEEARTGCLPGFELEQRITKQVSVGVSTAFKAASLFPSTSEGLPGFLLGLSANYYGKGSFQGLWLQFNLRDKFYETGERTYSQVVAVSPMIGYRWMGEDHPSNFALSVGVEKNLASPSNWMVLAKAEVGLRFLWSEIFN